MLREVKIFHLAEVGVRRRENPVCHSLTPRNAAISNMSLNPHRGKENSKSALEMSLVRLLSELCLRKRFLSISLAFSSDSSSHSATRTEKYPPSPASPGNISNGKNSGLTH